MRISELSERNITDKRNQVVGGVSKTEIKILTKKVFEKRGGDVDD